MARSEITIGFVGSGKVEKRNAYALLTDFIEASGGNAKFIFPMTKGFWNPALEVVSQYALDKGIPVEAIVDDTTAKTRELKLMLTGARRQHQSSAVAHKMASLLEESRKSALIVLWDDEDEGAMDAVKAADEKGVALLELTRGLDRIELVAGDEEEAEEEPVTDEIEDAEEVEEEGIQDDEDEAADGELAEDDTDPEEEAEFEEAEAEEDIDAEAVEDDDDEVADEEDDEEIDLPEEDESEVAAALDMEEEDDVAEGGMTEFQTRLIAVLEKTVEAFTRAINLVIEEDAVNAAVATVGKAPAKPAAARPAPKKAAAPAKAAPAKKAAPAPVKRTVPAKAAAKPAEKAPVKRTVPAKKAAAEPSTNGHKAMTKKAAQEIIDNYRPRRGRPPAEVTEARKILGLA